MAKGKKTGGRKKGSRNTRTKILDEVAAKGGLLPLDYMLQVMRDDNNTEARRDAMSVAAAPYLHAKRAPEDKHGEAQTYILKTNVDPNA